MINEPNDNELNVLRVLLNLFQLKLNQCATRRRIRDNVVPHWPQENKNPQKTFSFTVYVVDLALMDGCDTCTGWVEALFSPENEHESRPTRPWQGGNRKEREGKKEKKIRSKSPFFVLLLFFFIFPSRLCLSPLPLQARKVLSQQLLFAQRPVSLSPGLMHFFRFFIHNLFLPLPSIFHSPANSNLSLSSPQNAPRRSAARPFQPLLSGLFSPLRSSPKFPFTGPHLHSGMTLKSPPVSGHRKHPIASSGTHAAVLQP